MDRKIRIDMLCCVAWLLLVSASHSYAQNATPEDSSQAARDRHFMELAFAQIGSSSDSLGLPIGAVVVYNGEVVGRAHNQNHLHDDPFQHAEMRALRDAIATFQEDSRNWSVGTYLKRCIVYTTLEPCPMCAGALLMAKVKRVVICMPDGKWGALGSVDRLQDFPHTIDVDSCDLSECRDLADLRFQSRTTQSLLWEIGKRYAQKRE